MKINRRQLRSLIESVIIEVSAPEGKFVNQDMTLQILTDFFGFMEGLRSIEGRTIPEKNKKIREFYKLMQDNQLTVDDKKIDKLLDQLIDSRGDKGHKLSHGKFDGNKVQNTPNEYNLDTVSYDILSNMNKLNKKMSNDYELIRLWDFEQGKGASFSNTYHKINNKDPDYMTIPKLR